MFQLSFLNISTLSVNKNCSAVQISLPLHKVLYLLHKVPIYVPATFMELQVWAKCTAYVQLVIENWQTVYIYIYIYIIQYNKYSMLIFTL
jgi:hypothetical protein